MATITTREIGTTAKNSPLTNSEIDYNFINLNSDKIETSAIGVTVHPYDAQIDLEREEAHEPTGFIRDMPLTMGVMEFSPDGVALHRINYNGAYTFSSSGSTFYDGTSLAARTFKISPVSVADGGDGTYIVYIGGIRRVFTSSKSVAITDTSGLKYIYFDNTTNELATNTTFSFTYFQHSPITSVIYWDSTGTTNKVLVFGDERHGIQMDGFVHRYLHFTIGTKYVSGMALNGLTAGGTTFSSVDSGIAYDEDIYMQIAQQSTAPHVYLSGTTWTQTAPNNSVALLAAGVAQYNLNTTGSYSLTSVVGNDAMIVFFCLTNNKQYPYIKILSQLAYNSVTEAKAAVATAVNDISLAGLPAPEFSVVGAVIVNAAGQVQTLSDGSTWLDLRTSKISGGGQVSGTTQDHGNLTGLADDDHLQYHTDARGDLRYEPKNSNIQSHISNSSNPHNVTYSQVGADPAGTAVALAIALG